MPNRRERRSSLRHVLAVCLVAAAVAGLAAAAPSTATVDWQSGFEQTWGPWQGLQYTGPRSESFRYVTSPVRTGTYAAEFITRQGYGAYSGEGPNLCCGPAGEGAPGSEHYWAWSSYFPTDWVGALHWGIFFQLHQGNDMPPPLAFEANADSVSLDIRTGSIDPSQTSWSYGRYPTILRTLAKGHWNDFVLHVRWSVTDGRVQVWHRLPGEPWSLVLDLDHIPTLQQYPDGHRANVYTLLGFYRDSYCGAHSVTPGCGGGEVQPDNVLYDDNFVRGASFDEVATAAWGAEASQARRSTPARAHASRRLGSAISTATDAGSPGYLDVSGPYTLPRVGSVRVLTARITGERSAMAVRGVIYRDASGAPGDLVATTHQTVTPAARRGWVALPFAAPVRLPPGRYWLGYWYGPGTGSGGGGFHFDAAARSEAYARVVYHPSGPAPSRFPHGSRTASSRYALYAAWSPAVPGK